MCAETDFADLIGKPFAYAGRGPDAYDCWGLVMEAHRRWHGAELPDYQSTDDMRRNAEVMLRERERSWRRLARPEPGAVIVMSIRSIGCHVGFVVSPTRFIHAVENHSVLIERINRRFRVIGAYEHAA